MRKYSPYLIACLYLAVCVFHAVVPAAAQQIYRPANAGRTGVPYQWQQFDDVAIYFSDFNEIQRIEKWIFTTQTPSGNSSSLVNSAAKTLPVSDVPNPDYCSNRCTQKGEIYLYFHAGGDKQTYEQASRNSSGVLQTWSAKCTVQVDCYTATGINPFSTQVQILELNEMRPEQLFIVDKTVHFPKACGGPGSDILDHITVTVVSYDPPALTNVASVIRLEAGYKEQVNVDSRIIGQADCFSEWPTLASDYVYYVLSQSGPDQYEVGNDDHNSASSALTFRWTNSLSCVSDEFPNYQFQLLRLYNTDPNNTDPYIAHCTVDWSRALTLETGSKAREITLTVTEGQGFYIWRVRPIGNYYEGGITNPRNWGCWSPSFADGTTIDLTYDAEDNRVGFEGENTPYPVFFYQQFDDSRNWGYQRSFNETGTDGVHIHEGIVYANALLNPVQSQVKLHAENVVVGLQTVYDHTGRAGIQTLPAPIISNTVMGDFVYQQKLGYKPGLLLNSGGTLYSASNFEQAAVSANTASSALGPIHTYYSDANKDRTVPGAGGYPFASISYYRDGRIKEQSGVGVTHRMGESTPRTNRIFYASVADRELVSIFGDEAPAAETVSKVITVDPNGTATVQYLSREGQLLATCSIDAGELPTTLDAGNVIPASGDNSSLLNLSGEKVNVLTIEDEISGGQLLDPYTFRAAKTYVFLKPINTVLINYEITPKAFNDACLNYCGKCDYEVEVKITNAVTGEVVFSTNPPVRIYPTSGVANACNTAKLTPHTDASIQLPPGTYVIERIVRTNIKDPASSTALEGQTWHMKQALDKIRPLNDILGDMHLVEKNGVQPSLSAYKDFRTQQGRIYHTLTTGGSNASWCGGITLPDGNCPTGCPQGNEFPSFEQYLFEEMNDVNGALNNWFKDAAGDDKYPTPYPDYSGVSGYEASAFPAGRRMFDELIWNMVNDGYNCERLWDRWKAAVAMFKSQQTGNGVPKIEGKTVDLLEVFLEYALTDVQNGQTRTTYIQGRRANPYGSNIAGSEGYLSHAYKFIAYTNNSHPLCEYYTEKQFPGFIAAMTANTNNDNAAAWQALYDCVRSSKDLDVITAATGCDAATPPEFPIIRPVVTPQDVIDNVRRKKQWDDFVDCIVATARKTIESCDSRCEELRPSFRQAVIDEYAPATLPDNDLECMVEALVENCRSGCEFMPVEKLHEIVVYENNVYPPVSYDDVTINLPGSEYYDAVNKRMNGSFTVRASSGGACAYSPDPDEYEYAEGQGTATDLLARYLTELLREKSRTCAEPCTVNFYQEALGFFGITGTPPDCIGTEQDWGDLTHVVIYPGSDGEFTTSIKTRSELEGNCCVLNFSMNWKVRLEPDLAASVDNLNNMLNSLWGMPLPSFTPLYASDVATTEHLFIVDTTGGNPPPPSFYKHAYYQYGGGDPWKDSVQRYAHMLKQPTSNTVFDGLSAFKVLPGAGDDDYADVLGGVIASKATDVFSVVDAQSSSATWRTYGTIVLQMPRESLEEPVQKIVIRLTRADADSNKLGAISMDMKIGDAVETTSLPFPTTMSMEELQSYLNKPLTEAVGKFVVTSDGKIGFVSVDKVGDFTAEPFIKKSTSASVAFDASCLLCAPASCGVCIAWHAPVENPGIPAEYATTFVMMDCEHKEIERLKDLIAEQYGEFVNTSMEQIRTLYATTCGSPANVDDKLTVEYGERYYHYTLFYYDRAGHLIRSIQPKGVELANAATRTRNDHPAHTYETQYDINSAGQVVRNTTPDGGESKAFYNSIGQLRFSQNAQQILDDRALYCKYDTRGRLIETAEFTPSAALATLVDDNSMQGDKNYTYLQYDIAYTSNPPQPYSSQVQRNTRNKLTQIHYSEEYFTINFANWQMNYFSYDEHGRREWEIVRIAPRIGGGSTRNVSKIDYEHDLVSGNLLKVKYREGFADQFFQRYHYDMSDRLVRVESSRDGRLWEKDADYSFYLHGPLRRTAIGEDSVQGRDYVYTIQGWLKGINHPSLLAGNDPGGDGDAISGGVGTTKFAPDAFGMMFEYFPNDFNRSYSGTNSPFFAATSNSYYFNTLANKPLYDGTIRAWSTNIRPPVQTTSKQLEIPTGYAFRYDRLYRLRSGDFASYSSNSWHADGDYEEYHEYDPNGNPTYLRRWARAATPLNINAQKKMDEMDQYTYTGGTNRLRHMAETISISSNYPDDIDGPIPTDNYTYDAAGRIIADCKEDIEITWDGYDRVIQVINYNGSSGDCNSSYIPTDKSRKIVYRYDGAGRKIFRDEYAYNPTNGQFESTPLKSTRYMYGSIGLMAVYEQEGTGPRKLKEWPLYSQGRIGTVFPDGEVTYSNLTITDDGLYNRPITKKLYELTDHLGNVTAVVSDAKLVDGSGFLPDLRSYTNYYPYGLPQPNRFWSAEEYRFGYNGVEKENSTFDNGTAGSGEGKMLAMDFRMYDARLGRWWGQDPIVHPWESPYVGMGNNPVNFSDPSGLAPIGVDFQPRNIPLGGGGSSESSVVPKNSSGTRAGKKKTTPPQKDSPTETITPVEGKNVPVGRFPSPTPHPVNAPNPPTTQPTPKPITIPRWLPGLGRVFSGGLAAIITFFDAQEVGTREIDGYRVSNDFTIRAPDGQTYDYREPFKTPGAPVPPPTNDGNDWVELYKAPSKRQSFFSTLLFGYDIKDFPGTPGATFLPDGYAYFAKEYRLAHHWEQQGPYGNGLIKIIIRKSFYESQKNAGVIKERPYPSAGDIDTKGTTEVLIPNTLLPALNSNSWRIPMLFPRF